MTTELRYQSDTRQPIPPRVRPRHRLLARALASSLDRQLAAGSPPQFSQGLAIRADDLASPATRQQIARRWGNVLGQAARPPVPRSPRGALRRDAVIAARAAVEEMIGVLTSGPTIDARGAAMTSALLRDGTGPLYNRRSPADLGAAVRAATAQMNSLTQNHTQPDCTHPDNAACWQ